MIFYLYLSQNSTFRRLWNLAYMLYFRFGLLRDMWFMTMSSLRFIRQIYVLDKSWHISIQATHEVQFLSFQANN